MRTRKKNLYGFKLPSGKKLGDATKTEVREAAHLYRKRDGQRAQVNGRWMQAIVDKWPVVGVPS